MQYLNGNADMTCTNDIEIEFIYMCSYNDSN